MGKHRKYKGNTEGRQREDEGITKEILRNAKAIQRKNKGKAKETHRDYKGNTKGKQRK